MPRDGRSRGGDLLPRIPEAAVQLGALHQRDPRRGRAREPVKEFLGQIARLDRLGEFLRNIRFREDYFHSHMESESLLWQVGAGIQKSEVRIQNKHAGRLRILTSDS